MLERKPADSLTLLDHVFLLGPDNFMKLLLKFDLGKESRKFITVERLRVLYSESVDMLLYYAKQNYIRVYMAVISCLQYKSRWHILKYYNYLR